MRSILKYTPMRQFSTNKLGQVIQQTAESLKQQQSNSYLKYEDIFFKLYTLHLQRQQKVAYDVKKLDSLCMLGEFPCRSIVEHFHITAKNYSEEYTVQTFVRLSRAYKISQADNASTADFFINRLFFTPEFENLIEEYKFGLRKENAMKWDNAFLVAECLIDIGYADYEVFSILLNMVETKLNKQQRNDTEVRLFQIQKKDYYLKKHRKTHQNLINDPEFQAVLKMLSQNVRNYEAKNRKAEGLKDLRSELTVSEEQQNIYHSILETVSLIESYNQNLTKLIEGIITIRKQYRKMVKLSENKDILRNPEFNLELLELEQMLLVKKLISMTDIKIPERIDNENIQLKRVEEILISMIEPQGISLNPSDISDFINANINEGESKEALRLNKLKEIGEYGRAIAILSRFSEISRRLYNSPDSRSLISMKWEKTLLGWTQGGNETKEWKENLHSEKIFRRMFSDLYKMVKRSYSILMFTFIEAPLKYKVEFFEALTRLGFHDELIQLLENQDFSKEKVENHSNAEFFSLIKTLNEVGYKINAEHLKKATVKHLKKLYEESEIEENKSLFTMQFCTNAVNFMVQNFNVQTADLISTPQSKDEIQILYDSLVNRLVQQVKYFEEGENFLTNDQLFEAYRVLAMERSGEFSLGKNFYSRFGVDVSSKKQLQQFLYRKNPFNSIVNELCEKYQLPQLKNHHPFIQTGFNSKGDLTAVLICSSDQSSMDGKHPTGHTSAYIHRVKREFDISITPLSVNSFLEIDYDRLPEGKEFIFKPKQEISVLLNQLFKRDELHIIEFSSILTNIASLLQKHYKRSYMYALVKFLNTLNSSVRLFNQEKEILSFELWRFRRYRLFVQLDLLKEDYNLIDKSIKEQLEKMWKKESSVSSKEFFKKHTNVISVIEAIQQTILLSVNVKDQQSSSFTPKSFEGKRFSIETFIQEESKNPNIGIEFINTTAYIDKTYCQYNDWLVALKENYPLDTVKLSSSSNVIKILTKRFLPNVKEELTLLPFTKKSTLKLKPQFHINSLAPLPSANNQSPSTQKISQSHLQEIKELLSFIHELKLSKSQEELIEYIFSFDFISQLGQKSTEKSKHHAQPLPRDNLSYFNYLETANNKIYLESPNLEHLFNKLEQKEEIAEAYNSRKKIRAEAMIEFKLGTISRKEYLQKIEKADDQIIARLQTLSKNVLDNVEEYRLIENGLKMVKIEKDEREIERVLNRARYYYRNLDKDFVQVKGSVERCLKIKRNKAERILSLYSVLYKVAKGESELSEHEKEVLKKEASHITFRLENKKDHNDIFAEKFSHLSIGDLSKADKQRLNLGGSNLSKFSNLALTDLILELVNLLDPKVYENFERSIMKKYYTSAHNIPQEIFASGLNKQYTKLAHEQQRAIINESSMLDFYDIGLLNEMVQTFKTESKSGKERFAHIYGSFYEDIEGMNNSEARVQLISQYLDQKEIEYIEDYCPKLITETKEREALKLWEMIFKEPYEYSETQNIRQTVNKLCERIRIMADNVPPFFGLLVIKILSHPKTDSLSKQNLISSLSQFKTPLKMDSQDIRTLGEQAYQYQKQTLPSSERLVQHLGLISNKNFMEQLNKKINMIV